MKLLKITEILITDAPLSGVKIDEIVNMLDPASPHTDIRFEQSTYGEYGGYDIVGDRWETTEEARKRLDKAKKEREAKKKAKKDRIEALELQLAKLKANRRTK